MMYTYRFACLLLTVCEMGLQILKYLGSQLISLTDNKGTKHKHFCFVFFTPAHSPWGSKTSTHM